MRISDWSSDVCSSDLCQISQNTTVDGDHGRIETRATTVIHNLDWLPKDHGWPGLKAVVIVDSIRETGDKATHETRLYLTPAQLPAEQQIGRASCRERVCQYV